MRYFVTRFLEEADDFVSKLDQKSANKVFYNIDLAEQTTRNYSKNLKGKYGSSGVNIWETKIDFFSFWDKTEKTESLVLATHGFVKKTQKVPQKEIDKAERIRQEYFKRKKNYDNRKNEIIFTCRNEG